LLVPADFKELLDPLESLVLKEIPEMLARLALPQRFLAPRALKAQLEPIQLFLDLRVLKDRKEFLALIR
jgi:hypothetical protein